MIERSARRHSYTVIDNRPLNDKRLDWDAKGLLAYLLSKPDHWRVDRSHLASVVPSGAGKVQRLLRLLEEAGYLTRERDRNQMGQLVWKHVVHEVAVAPERRTSVDSTTDGVATDGKPITGSDQQEQGVSAGGTTDRFPTDGSAIDGKEAPLVNKEAGRTEGVIPEEEGLKGAAAPAAQSDNLSLFQAQGLPDDSPESRGSPSPDGAAPPPPSVSQNGHGGKKAGTAEIVQQVFEAWQKGTNHPGAKLVDARRRKITARSREGFTVEQLVCVVAEAWKHDPWPERVNNNDLVTLLRDGPQVERFLEMYRKAKATSGNGHHADPDEALRQAREFNARQEARTRAANTTDLGRRLAAEAAAHKGADQ
jgi:ASC-1-like (ASCH) protein